MEALSNLDALDAEVAALSSALRVTAEDGWNRPTRCHPWTVRQLVGHVLVVLGRVVPMIDAPAPGGPAIPAAEYYRPDRRFSSRANRERVQAGVDEVRELTGRDLPNAIDRTITSITRQARDQAPDRLVTTRHGDVMRLDDFLTTRTVEVVLHGIDIADGLETTPWTTSTAGDLVLRLLMGDAVEHVRSLGWQDTAILRSATGRSGPDGPTPDALRDLGVVSLTLS